MRSFLREIEGRSRSFAIVAMTIVVSLTGGGAQDRDKPLRPTGLAPEHVEANLVLVDAWSGIEAGSPFQADEG